MRHSKNCAIHRSGDLRAWCDCGAFRRAQIKLMIFEIVVSATAVAVLWGLVYLCVALAV